MSLPDLRPRWMRELERLALYKTQIYLYGNIKDTMLYPLGPDQQNWTLGPLRESLFELFRHRLQGYEIVASYNFVDGMVFADMAESNVMAKQYNELVAAVEKAAPKPPGGRAPHPIKLEGPTELAMQQMRLCLINREHPCVFMLEHASQLVRDPAHLEFSERASLLRLLKASSESQIVAVKEGETRRVVQNLLILLCDKQADLPPWLYLGNPFTGSIEIEHPRSYERRHFFELFMAPRKKAEETKTAEASSAIRRSSVTRPRTPAAGMVEAECSEEEALRVRLAPAGAVATLEAPAPQSVAGIRRRRKPSDKSGTSDKSDVSDVDHENTPALEIDYSELVDLTDGMAIRDLCGIRAVARRPENGDLHAKALVDCYKYGVRESEWDALDWSRLDAAEEVLSQRVIGQPAAVTAVADMVRRARLAPFRRATFQPHQAARRALLRRLDRRRQNGDGQSAGRVDLQHRRSLRALRYERIQPAARRPAPAGRPARLYRL